VGGAWQRLHAAFALALDVGQRERDTIALLGGQAHRLTRARTNDRGLHRPARRRFGNDPREMADTANALSVEFGDDVARLQPRFRGSAVLTNLFNHHAALFESGTGHLFAA